MSEKLREAAQQALTALENATIPIDSIQMEAENAAIAALRSVLEEPEPVQEPLTRQQAGLRRGDILRCAESGVLCTVWATSTSGKALVKWGPNDFGSYTAEQIGELFWVEPRVQEPVAWLDQDINASYTAAEMDGDSTDGLVPLYAAPPQRPPLTAQEPDVPESNFGNLKPAGWFEPPHGAFRANPQFHIRFPSQLLSWQIPLYTHPPKAEPKPVQEPVAWMDIAEDGTRLSVRQWSDGNSEEVPLYTAPPQSYKQEALASMYIALCDAIGYSARSNELQSPEEWAAQIYAHYALTTLTAKPAQKPLTIERLRDALVASRIIPPAAVEEPDEYDDGVTLCRIEALHRRLT